jgi:NDP-4-keto-2,6-dideoxyhexose 3-C-methyltransferase
MKIKTCRSCKSTELVNVIDLGEQYLADFRSDDQKSPKFNLELTLCMQCSLLQLTETVPRDLMYHERYGYKSGVNEMIKQNLKNICDEALSESENVENWLDIACNDGTLLSNVPESIYRVGIDPVKKFKKESQQFANQIISDYFPSVEIANLKFDVITSISMFYDLDDPNEFVKDIKKHLSEKGIWIVQQNYVLSMIQNNSFDNICHEHIEYYSLKSFITLISKHDLEVYKVELDEINGGSIRTIVGHKNNKPIQKSVKELLGIEEKFGLSNVKIYSDFNKKIYKIKVELQQLMNKILESGKTIGIYGASTRSLTIWQLIGLDNEKTQYAVERQENKIGKNYGSLGIKIVSEDFMRKNPTDFLFVGPWFLRENFLEREKEYLNESGAFIFPLPEVEIVGKS